MILPFKGRWFTAQAGDTINVNHHMAILAQRFGIDFVKVAGPSGRSLSSPNPKRKEDFFSWNEKIYSPEDGEVINVVDGFPDQEIGSKDPQDLAGNYVCIKTGDSKFIFLAHFQNGTIKVKRGDKLIKGQLLGLCGNSGNSDYPHLHMHIQGSPVFNEGSGQNFTFENIQVELSGMTFRNATWPLIRGLFVEQELT